MLLDHASDEDFGTEAERSRHAAAQVHATLALAAATALQNAMPEWAPWRKAAGAPGVAGIRPPSAPPA
jgi:hypothetical protein